MLDSFASFNTQPPEGGCGQPERCAPPLCRFNTQPPEGGCHNDRWAHYRIIMFQHTAARRRLHTAIPTKWKPICFNTQPPEGGCMTMLMRQGVSAVSTHSRPKAAALIQKRTAHKRWFQHTAARRRLRSWLGNAGRGVVFQHTAARRRLLRWIGQRIKDFFVSTHSRPKAAAKPSARKQQAKHGFNTQPPEGGCESIALSLITIGMFQHTAARRRLQPLPQPASAKAFTPLFRQAAGKGCGTSIAQPWFAFSAPLIY